ncbi:conserved protein of unknown function [Streptococcus thermophilus]|uniref:Integrase catalytic domain-containing protein n=1 Tax=Streptococcus thermophilus TaxID=1308 RepID=A0A8D6U3P8_STRTR|nr:conserved protein of unknown function [Streptococcus thermophilus]
MVTEFPLDILLNIIKLARSTYYYHLKQLNQVDKNQSIKVEIQAIYDEHKGNYGYRRITLELRNRGFVVNQKKVQRLMKLLGLSSQIRRKRKYSSYQGEVGKKADNLSDQGWQYQHQYYHQFLENKGTQPSMSRKGNSPDNGMMGSFFGILKSEIFYGYEKTFHSLEQLEQAIVDYIDYYNNKLIKVKLKGLISVQYRTKSFV